MPPDFKNMSDAELEAFVAQNEQPDFSQMSDADLEQFVAQNEAPSAEPGFFTGLQSGLEENLTGLATRGLAGEDLTQERELPFEFGLNAPTAGFVAGQVADPIAALTALTGGGAVAKGAQLLNVGKKALTGARIAGQAAGPALARFAVDPNVTPAEVGTEAAVGATIPLVGRTLSRGLKGATRPFRSSAIISDATQEIEDKIKKIGGGSVPDRTTAGDLVEESFERANQRVNSQLTASYDSIVEQAPGLQIRNVGDLGLTEFLQAGVKKAKNLASRSSKDVKQAGQALKDEIRDFGRAIASNDLGQVRDQMKLLERKVFEGGGADPAVAEFRREAQKKLREVFARSVSSVDKNLGKQLSKSNERISKFIRQGQRIKKVLSKDVAESKKFDQIFSLQGKDDINFLVNEMLDPNPEIKNQLKAAFLDSIKPVNRVGELDPSKFARVLKDRRKRQVVTKLFEDTELQPIIEQANRAIKAGRFKRAVQILSVFAGSSAVASIGISRLLE